MPKPLFMSLPSVSARISNIKSKIPEEFLRGKTEVEQLLLRQNDMSLQQNEELGRNADEANKILEEVKEQVLETNGKVKDHESRITASEAIIKGYQAASSRRTAAMVMAIPVLGFIIQVVAKHFGWTS